MPATSAEVGRAAGQGPSLPAGMVGLCSGGEHGGNTSLQMQMTSLRGVIELEGGLVAHPVYGTGKMDGVTPRLDSILSF